MQVLSLGCEDLWEEGMAIHSSILAWRIPWIEEPGGLQSIGHTELDTTEAIQLQHTKGYESLPLIDVKQNVSQDNCYFPSQENILSAFRYLLQVDLCSLKKDMLKFNPGDL